MGSLCPWLCRLDALRSRPQPDHPTEPCLLMRQETAGWALPYVEFPERVWFPPSQPIIPRMRDAVGVDAVVLGYVIVAAAEPAAESHRRADYVMEAHDPAAPLPSDSRWIGQQDILDLV